MKKGIFIPLTVVFILEIVALVYFSAQGFENSQSVIKVNEIVQSVNKDIDNMENHVNKTGLDYVVTDSDGEVIYRTAAGLSESINSAVSHHDIILDIDNGGKVIVYNDSEIVKAQKNKIIAVFVSAVVIQFAVCVIYLIYLNKRIIMPFSKLKGFAERVSAGNLDIPLEMDRGNLFGAFTESFDIMRSELKKARIAEAKANASKKELVAKLSHDIRTPTASIKAVSELGAATCESEKNHYTQIIQKADQINTLVTNLFSATLEDLQQLSVSPSDMQSKELSQMLVSADYLCRARIPEIPQRMIYADKLRLQQVFDNIFANSYKYADTEINVKITADEKYLTVEIEDFGGGVSMEELPALKEKFVRGSNSENIDGAGLGLYISDRFMTEMKGELKAENGEKGLKITVFILLSGTL